jgi:hypothetical protein
MDGVLQASLALVEDLPWMTRSSTSPGSLDCLRIVSACPRQMLAWVRPSLGSGPASGASKLDADLCDLQGNICVQLRGISLQEPVSLGQPVLLHEPVSLQEPAAAHTERSQPVHLVNLQQLDAPADVGKSAAKPGSVALVGLQDVGAVASLTTADTSKADVSGVPSLEQLQRQLKESLAEALYMEAAEIDGDKPFVELGLDSIVGVEWV